MTDCKVEVDPGEVGFDATRLDRIEGHFQDYVDDGRLAGWLVTVARDGKLVYVVDYGKRDIEADLPVEQDTIWRIYSMTKPITSLAAMMLWEQGLFDLNDPVEAYIPSFHNGRVDIRGSAKDLETTPVHQPVRIWNLLSHTSGLSYGHTDHPVDQGYLKAEKAASRRRQNRPRGNGRRLGQPAAPVRARHPLVVLTGHRRGRPAGGGSLRPVARRLLWRAHPSTAGDDRYRLLGARRQNGPLGQSVRA